MSAWPDHCSVINCRKPWAVLVADRFRPDIREACFGLLRSSSYEEWAEQPHGFYLCRRHESRLRNADAVELGYKMVDGQLRAYVKHADW